MGICFEYLSLLFGNTELFTGLEFLRLGHVVVEIFVKSLGRESVVLEAAFEFYRKSFSHFVLYVFIEACLFFVIPSYINNYIRPG
jgi:hypothetical protein